MIEEETELTKIIFKTPVFYLKITKPIFPNFIANKVLFKLCICFEC